MTWQPWSRFLGAEPARWIPRFGGSLGDSAVALSAVGVITVPHEPITEYLLRVVKPRLSGCVSMCLRARAQIAMPSTCDLVGPEKTGVLRCWWSFAAITQPVTMRKGAGADCEPLLMLAAATRCDLDLSFRKQFCRFPCSSLARDDGDSLSWNQLHARFDWGMQSSGESRVA